jgi:hypothetical protein
MAGSIARNHSTRRNIRPRPVYCMTNAHRAGGSATTPTNFSPDQTRAVEMSRLASSMA